MDLESLRYVYLRRVVGTVLSALGFDAGESVARRLARGVFDLNTAGRRLAEVRLRTALGGAACETDIAKIAAGMYEHVGRFWIEALHAQRRLRRSSWRRFVTVNDESAFRALTGGKRGCVLATGYFGNPAVGALAMGQIFRPLHVIVDTFAQPHLRAWQRELFASRWVRPIDRRDAATAVPRVLGDGGALMMICEHERPHGRGVRAAFLGRSLNCYPTLGRLARWYDVPVAVFTCRRGRKPFSFHLDLHACVEHEPSDLTDEEIVRRVLSHLDEAVMRRPEQYLWSLPEQHPRRLPAAEAKQDAAGADLRQFPIDTGTESASFPRTRRTASAWQRPSAAGSMPACPEAAAEPAPTV
ncbi:MAG: lysophospholipid acyltransferase family protein [Planctomycetota bacterium]